MTVKGLVVLGSTGSIGRQTLDVVRAFPDRFKVVGLAAGLNVELLMRQVEEFKPSLIFCADAAAAESLSSHATFLPMEEMVCDPRVDTIMVGTTGRAGLMPTIKALEEGRTVCLANKEVINHGWRVDKPVVAEAGRRSFAGGQRA